MTEDNCPLCKIKKREIDAAVVFEDDEAMAVMHPLPANKGHLLVFPKEHRQIITEVDDEHLTKMFSIAQKLSAAVFDAFAAQGTNILVQNGETGGQTLNHFCLHVIPRNDGDGISLEWQPKPGDEAQLSMLEQKLKDAAKDIEAPKDDGNVIKGGDNNYMIRQLRRIG